MDVTKWSSIAVAIIGAIAALAQQRRRASPRDHIKADIDIWSSLPESSAARDSLLNWIDDQIKALITIDRGARRDPLGVTIGLILLGAGAWGTALILSLGGAWRWLLVVSVFALMLGIYGSVESIRRVPRNEKGRS